MAGACDLCFKRELADNLWHSLESILSRGACAGIGSLPIMNYRPIRSMAPLRHGRECIYFDSQDDLVTQVERWLNMNTERLDDIVAAGQERLKQHYTFHAIAHYIIAEITTMMEAKKRRK